MFLQWNLFNSNQNHNHWSANMSKLDFKSANPDEYLPPRDDEEALVLDQDWTKDEEAKAKRK